MFTNIWRRHFNLVLVAVIAVGLVAGAALGAATKPGSTVVAQSTSSQSGAGAAAASSGQGTGGGRQSGGTAAADQSARPVMGSIASIDANTVRVSTQQGDTQVKLAGAKVTKVVDGSADDLSKGAHVTAVAQQQADGSYTATTVQVTPVDQAGGGVTVPSGGAGGAAQGAGRNQAQAQQGSNSRQRPIVGTVSALDAGVLTIATQQGDTKVNVGSARIQKTVDGSSKDLQAGQRVLVTGQAAQDGSYETAQIEILASVDTGSQGAAGATTGKVQ